MSEEILALLQPRGGDCFGATARIGSVDRVSAASGGVSIDSGEGDVGQSARPLGAASCS